MTQTATVTPEAHRFRALARANEIRTARAELKRRIALGESDAAEVILDPPLAAHRWPVGDLLVSQRGWGEARVRRFLMRNHISERKPIGELTERQRHMLAGQLGALMSLSR
jgi:hypothetical protein